MKNAYIYNTRLGKILIADDGESITVVSVLPENFEEDVDLASTFGRDYSYNKTDLIEEAAKQLKEYLEGCRKIFTVKIKPQGTEFQKRVWEVLLTIPYGETRSYKQIAMQSGNGKASRAVGMANHNNPILCIIPCHRVIGANGTLVGYTAGLSTKEKLLIMEKGSKVYE